GMVAIGNGPFNTHYRHSQYYRNQPTSSYAAALARVNDVFVYGEQGTSATSFCCGAAALPHSDGAAVNDRRRRCKRCDRVFDKDHEACRHFVYLHFRRMLGLSRPPSLTFAGVEKLKKEVAAEKKASKLKSAAKPRRVKRRLNVSSNSGADGGKRRQQLK